VSVVTTVPMLLGDEGYQISRSVRIRSSASAYFNRTPASASNRRTWTWSGWIKRGALGGNNAGLLTALDSGGVRSGIMYENNNQLIVYNNNTSSARYQLAQLHRDVSAWYHIVVAYDTTQATAANRILVWVNGVLNTATTGTLTYPSQNYEGSINNTVAHNIGRDVLDNTYFDGYMTEVNLIDGQALTPSSFGETNPITGVWQPKKYTGTYGTNGFFLTFQDNSAATATTIGKDYSGNGNNWTPNNISVTAGSTYDSMLDVPTLWADGGNGRGNYCVLNPIFPGSSSYLSGGNLNASISATNTNVVSTMQLPTSGKWYWEYQITTIGGGGAPMGGIATTSATSPAVFYRTNGNKLVDGTETSYGATYTTTDTIGVAVDVDGGTVAFYKNNSSQGNITYSGGGFYAALRSNAATDVFNINFGQRPFSYTPPTGFKALNTGNLPEPTIVQGNKWMDATIYTGTGATQTITNSGSMQPDFVWAKSRSSAESHRLEDSVRGATQALYSNLTNAETTEAQSITAFNSGGFTLGTGTPNTSAVTYVAWQWKAGGTPAVTNTAGSTTSTVSASTTSGFSVVTYTGTGANATVGHGLGVAPKLVIVKRRNGVMSWAVWQTALAGTEYLLLDQTQAKATAADVWNSTIPTSTVFSVGTNQATNLNTATYVAYLFADVAGFSAFGSYTGNGSSAGPFVYLGFRPEFIMIKRTDTTGSWLIVDAARSPANTSVNGGMQNVLVPNTSGTEDTGADICDGLSNGFKFYQGAASFNANGGTYIYMAFAQNPFRYALAR